MASNARPLVCRINPISMAKQGLILAYIALLLLAITACNKDAPIGPQQVDNGCGEDSISADPTTRVYIINEGNFTWGNASLSVYDPATQTVVNNAFAAANDRPLGDVAQSLTLVGQRAYLIVNNSGKIEVLADSTLEATHTITGFNSPRELFAINAKTAYVSDLYANALAIVDLVDHPNNSSTQKIQLYRYNGSNS